MTEYRDYLNTYIIAINIKAAKASSPALRGFRSATIVFNRHSCSKYSMYLGGAHRSAVC